MIVKHNGWKSLIGLLLLAVLSAIGAPPALARSPVVTGVQVSGGSGKLKVNVTATGEIQYRVLDITDPRYSLVVEIFPAQLATNVKKALEVNSGLVEKVRVGQFSDGPDIVRLVIDLRSPTRYQVVMAPGRKGLTLAVGQSDVASAKVTKADVAPSGSTVAVAPQARPVAPARTVVRADVSAAHTYVVHNWPSGIARNTNRGQVAAAKRRKAAHVNRAPGRRISMDFVGADLIYVLKLLSKEMNVNLVTDQTVKGTVTMTLKDVPAEGALNLILRIAGFDYKRVDNTIVVGSKETIEKIPANVLEIRKMGEPEAILPIPLEHAKAASVADTLKGVYPGVDATVQADQNFVIVKGPRSQLRDIKEFVQKLDVPPPPPVVLKTEVVPIKYSTVQTTLQLAKALFPNLSYNIEDRLNAMIVTGQDKDIEAMKAFLATVDIPLQQVMLDIKVVDLNEQGSKQLGVTIGSNTGSFGVFGGAGGPLVFTEQFPPQVPVGSAPGTLPSASTTSPSLAIGPFVRTQFVIGATLSLLINNSDAKVISSPRVMTQSGKDAQVLIGDKFPIVYFDPRAGQFQVQYVDIGVKVVVKPTVSSDGYVTVDLAPEVSTLKALINNQYPQTGITTVKTNVRVKDGDTIVVGGLLRDIENVTVNKIPFLGDLPVLGEFFKSTNVQRQKSEVFIMVTPKIVQ